MKLTISDVNKFFECLDNFVNKRVDVVLIGGGSLLYYGLKPSTKDIDLVIEDRNLLVDLSPFFDLYSKENRIEIQYGSFERFQSMILNEDMTRHSREINHVKDSFLSTYKFKNLHIHLIRPVYLALIKIEASSRTGLAHLDEAIRIAKHFKITKDEMIDVFKEYAPEIDLIPRMDTSFNSFIEETFNEKDFDIKQHLN